MNIFKNRNKVHNHLNLNEVSRKQLVQRTKVQSPERVQRSKGYSAKKSIQIDVNKFLEKDDLVINVPVGSYNCILEFKGFLGTLIKNVKRKSAHNCNLDDVTKALRQSMDLEHDMKVDCTCPDFFYRYSYVATKNGYKYGKPQTVKAKVRNPNDNIGSFCKHLTAITNNKSWLRMFSTIVNDIIKAYYEDILITFDLSYEEFYINVGGRPSQRTSHNAQMFKDRESSRQSARQKFIQAHPKYARPNEKIELSAEEET